MKCEMLRTSWKRCLTLGQRAVASSPRRLPGPAHGLIVLRPSRWATSSTQQWLESSTENPRDAAPPITLRDYQEECVQSVLASMRHGHKRLGISLATGSGKTVIFTELIGRIPPVSDKATQTLIIAHRRELVEQAVRHCSRAYPQMTLQTEMGKLSASGYADITVASMQTLVSGDRLSKFDPARFKLILVDEAHHIVAPGYLKVLKHLGLRHKQNSSPILVGVSATFSRLDGLKLGAVIDELVYHRDYVDMIGGNYLSDVVFTTVESSADMSKVRRNLRGNGDFEISSLSKAVNTDQVNELTFRAWYAKAGNRKSTLVFCVDLDHVASLTQKFRSHGIDARFVTGETPGKERAARLDAFRNREFAVLVNCSVYTEGTDIPNVDCVLLARPTRSRNLLVQMIGRGMRLYPGKENCHIIDMVSSLGTGIVTTPTLFGLDPAEILDADSPKKLMQTSKERKAAEQAREALVRQKIASSAPYAGERISLTFTEYESVYDLISDTSGEKHIRAISPNAWVQVGAGRYVLSDATGTFLRLEKFAEDGENQGALYKAVVVRALPPGIKSKSPFASPREILKATTFIDAVHGCDSYASRIFPQQFISRRMRWRNGPPTDGQLKVLNQFRAKDNQITADDITKGKAADMITKIKHGARGRFADLEARKRQKARVLLASERDAVKRLGHKHAVGSVLG